MTSCIDTNLSFILEDDAFYSALLRLIITADPESANTSLSLLIRAAQLKRNRTNMVRDGAALAESKMKAASIEKVLNLLTMITGGKEGRNAICADVNANISATREQLVNVVATKPFLNTRSSFEKSGNKSGSPLKKFSDHKNSFHLGNVTNGGFPDYSYKLEDDREELMRTNKHACRLSIVACSSAFSKTIETLFVSTHPEGNSFLLQQLKLTKESCSRLSQFCSNRSADQGGEIHVFGAVSCTTSSVNEKFKMDEVHFNLEDKVIRSGMELLS